MAWVATDNLESYSNAASLTGGAGGSGWTGNWAGLLAGGFTITTADFAPFGSSTRSASATGNNGSSRALTSISSSGGSVEYGFWCKNTGGVTENWYHYGKAGTSARILMGFETGNIIAYNGGTPVVLLAAYSTSTWYYVQIRFGVTTDKFNAFVNTTGSTTDSYSIDCSFQASGSIDTITFERGGGSAASFLFDLIGPLVTTPTGTMRDARNLNLLGVG